VKLLEEIVSDYPRIWEFYKHNTGERERSPKHTQRYPVPIGTLSMIIDFHNWTHKTVYIVRDTVGIELPNNVRKTAVGPDPVVMFRLNWLDTNWKLLESRQKSLAKTLGGEVEQWHTRIRVKVNDADIYAYQATAICAGCEHRSVVRMNDTFICVNTTCRNPLTGEFRTWQIN